MSTQGILEQWERARAVIVVPMSGVQFVSFQQMSAIGTRDLGACSVVIIASQHAAILAHIPPQPSPPSSDPFAGDNNVRLMMSRVAALYQQHRGHFPLAETHVICALFRGAVALPDQMNIMSSSLQQMGLVPVIRTYQVPGNRSLPGNGTVIAIRGAGQNRAQVYVEDRPV